MWLLRGCLLLPRLWCTLTVRTDSGHGQSLAKRNSPPVFLWKGERKIVSSSLEMWTTIYKTQASLAATSFPCERNQLLAIGIILTTQRGRKVGSERVIVTFKFSVTIVPGTQVHFCFAQVLIVEIPFSSVRYSQYYTWEFLICLSLIMVSVRYNQKHLDQNQWL